MRILALDIGDAWTGTAISDPLGILAKPYKTIITPKLFEELAIILPQEKIDRVVIGHPKTMRGTTSDQTKKTEGIAEQLKEKFPTITFILWDERLSSKRADALKKQRTSEEKKASHSIAAAFILSSYLEFIRPQNTE